MKPMRWKVWLGAGLLFGAGVLAGGTLTAWLGVRAIRHGLQATGDGRTPAVRAAERVSNRLSEEMDLTPAQATKVRRTLAEMAMRIREERVSAVRKIRGEMERAVEEIAADLPEEKREQLREVLVREARLFGWMNEER